MEKKSDNVNIDENKEDVMQKAQEKKEQEYEELGLEEIVVEEPEKERPKGIIGFLKTRKADFWYRVLMGACMAVFVFAVVRLAMIFTEYGKAEKTYEDIESDYVTYEEVTAEEAEPGEETGENGEEPEDSKEETSKKGYVFKKANVDFKALQKKNKDVIGWIQFENFSLSYPVAHDSGDSYYLTHTIDKKSNKSGSIYVPASNKGDFNDTNTIIFGHNMKNGTMFGLLGRYKEKAFFELNQYFYIYTPSTEKKYQIFSVYVGDQNGVSYTIYGAKNDDYAKFLETLKKKSMYETGVSVSRENNIVTLSTCVSDDKTKRLIIHAKQIK